MPWWSAPPKKQRSTSGSPLPVPTPRPGQVGGEEARAGHAPVAGLVEDVRSRRVRGSNRGGVPGGPSPATARARVGRQSPPSARTATGQGVCTSRARAAWNAARPLKRGDEERPLGRHAVVRRRARTAPSRTAPRSRGRGGRGRAACRARPRADACRRAAGAGRSTASGSPPTPPGSCTRGPRARRSRTAPSAGMLPPLGVATRTTLATRRAPAQVTGASAGGSAPP